jgi:hypothetical protein
MPITIHEWYLRTGTKKSGANLRLSADFQVRLPRQAGVDVTGTTRVIAPSGTRASVLDGFEFPWKQRRVTLKAVEGTDIAHWMALETALQAVSDSGIELPRDRTAGRNALDEYNERARGA